MKQYIIEPGANVKLSQYDPRDSADCPGGKSEALPEIASLTGKLDQLQQVLYAQHEHKVLVVLQGMDTAGKDGTIRVVFDGVNPEGVKVANFKAPTPEELNHDFLWRVHRQVPGEGELVVFNRSHYEDVLIVRVHELVPKEVWKKRYDQINNFEKMLTATGTTILKFCLFISKDEQKSRLEARLADPDKLWKFNPADLKERDLWDDYMEAYGEMLSRTSTPWAPWILVPSDRKWYRNLIVARFVTRGLESLKLSFPEPSFDPAKIEIH